MATSFDAWVLQPNMLWKDFQNDFPRELCSEIFY
jgi:hypothetical protein